MRGLRWWRWGALLLVGVFAALFASLNAGERVALYLGFATLYQIPLVPLILGAFVVGMATMFVLGLRHDLHVRQALRDAGFGEPIAPGESAVTRGGWAAPGVKEERPPGADDEWTLSLGAAGSESDSAAAVPPDAPLPAILSGHEMPSPARGLPPHESPADELPLTDLPSTPQSHESPDELVSERLPTELPHEASHEPMSDRLPPEPPSYELRDRLPADRLPAEGATDKEADDGPRSGDVANHPQDSEELPPDVHSQPRSPP
jgi:uncharacterized integral membrane protein